MSNGKILVTFDDTQSDFELNEAVEFFETLGGVIKAEIVNDHCGKCKSKEVDGES